MKYFLIAGEASGDLHAAHLMHALRSADANAEFRFCGGDLMAKECGLSQTASGETTGADGAMLFHYRHLAYMGFVDVALHLGTILRGLRTVKHAIRTWQPDAVILVDYPGFNLRIARFVHDESLCPVYYYIAPKLWAWKEHRIKALRRNVDHTFCILPFETDFFEGKHGYPVTYVGSPSVDEIVAYKERRKADAPAEPAARGNEHGAGQKAQPAPTPLVALLPGSRRSEVKANLQRMLHALQLLRAEGRELRAAVAMAPSLDEALYREVAQSAAFDGSKYAFDNHGGQPLNTSQITFRRGATYELLQQADAALVTSGTATLETAIFGVPQVVCYHIRCGRFVNLLRRLFLKVKFISLVNLIAGREVVPELVAGEMRAERIANELRSILPDAPKRSAQLLGYAEIARRLGQPGAAERAAQGIVARIKAATRK